MKSEGQFLGLVELKIFRGAPKTFRHPKGGLRNNCWARRGAPKICILRNQQEGGGTPKKLSR